MKYIVEFEDEPFMYEDEVHFYKCIQAPWWGLSERVIEQLTPYQPEPDCVSRKTALDAFGLSEKTRKYGGDHSGYDTRMLYEIQDTLENLPAVQTERTEHIPETKAVRSKRDCVDLSELVSATFYDQEHEEWTQQIVTIADVLDSVCDEYTILPSVQPEPRWIPVTERLPENDNEVLITIWDAEDDYVEVYKGFYQGHEWWTQWCHGCSKIKDEPCGENIVIAWVPLPEPYRGGEKAK